jgi:hypothetical protein
LITETKYNGRFVFDLREHPSKGVYLFFGIHLDVELTHFNYMDQFKSNTPNAGKLISSLRNTGYDSYAAIEDIIDNSIDAQARVIKVNIESKDKELSIVVADNGSGMNEQILDQALRLGSLTERSEISDLGKFGMGLSTASISMAKKLEVITREKNSDFLYSCQDLDEVQGKNDFVKILRKANSSEISFFNNFIEEQGTIVILTKVDRLSDTNISQFASKLSKDISRIYRKFIDSGIEFYVNDKKLDSFDPLMSDNQETQIYSDEVYELPIIRDKKNKESIRIKVVILPRVNPELEKDLKMNIRTQGFYVLRNNREVAFGLTLDTFVKHNDLNRVRIELSFNASLDNEMGVRFTKDGVSPNQVISDFLKEEVGGQIRSIRNFIRKEQRVSDDLLVDHSGSETVIAQRAKLLITPEAEIEKRLPRTKKTENSGQNDPTEEKERENFKKTKTSPHGLGARFESAAMGREGTLYEAYQQGKLIIIRWNTDHPFYDRVILANKDSKDIVSALDYLVYALASAELKNINDENVELMANIKSVMSTNLRALLS